jgi:hypothetical protein
MQRSPRPMTAFRRLMRDGAVNQLVMILFAIAFSIVGSYGWLVHGRDLGCFALFAGAIQALLTVKSGLQDYHDRQMKQQSTQSNSNK